MQESFLSEANSRYVVMKCLIIMEAKCSSLCSQEPATVSYTLMISFHTPSSCFFQIQCNINLTPSTECSKLSSFEVFQEKHLYSFLMSLKHDNCPNHLILLHMIFIIISGEEYKLAYEVPNYEAVSTLLAPNPYCVRIVSLTL
jgi:hypothetical protein